MSVGTHSKRYEKMTMRTENRNKNKNSNKNKNGDEESYHQDLDKMNQTWTKSKYYPALSEWKTKLMVSLKQIFRILIITYKQICIFLINLPEYFSATYSNISQYLVQLRTYIFSLIIADMMENEKYIKPYKLDKIWNMLSEFPKEISDFVRKNTIFTHVIVNDKTDYARYLMQMKQYHTNPKLETDALRVYRLSMFIKKNSLDKVWGNLSVILKVNVKKDDTEYEILQSSPMMLDFYELCQQQPNKKNFREFFKFIKNYTKSNNTESDANLGSMNVFLENAENAGINCFNI